MTHDCPGCHDHLHADEEWRLRPGVPPVGEATKGDYVHAGKCYRKLLDAMDRDTSEAGGLREADSDA